MKTKLKVGIVAALAALLGVSGPALAAGGGIVTGKVVYVGTPPAPKMLEVTKDTPVCGKEMPAEDLVIGQGNGVRWAVVSLAGVAGTPGAPADPAPLDQKGCRFTPRVVVVPKGQAFTVLNSDGILHNVHTYSEKNAAINKAQPGFMKQMKVTFGEAEIIKVKCDVHSWMTGYMVVTDNPFVVVTDESGAFRLADVPPGTYKMDLWHETLGRHTKEITVKAGEQVQVSFELSAS